MANGLYMFFTKLLSLKTYNPMLASGNIMQLANGCSSILLQPMQHTVALHKDINMENRLRLDSSIEGLRF